MADNMKVRFLRGAQASLPTSGIQEGSFYLTNDTNRLYFGQDSTHLTLLNQTVEIVKDLAALQAISAAWTPAQKADHVNDFYYIVDSNILAVWCQKNNVYDWVQINPDTNSVLQDVEIDVTNTDNGASVEFTVSDDAAHSPSESVSFKGEGSVSVSGAGKEVTIKGEKYSISEAVASNEASVKLSSDVDSTGSTVKIKGGENVTVEQGNAGQIVVKAQDSVIQSAEVGINAEGKITLTVNDDAAHSVDAVSSQAISFKVGDQTYLPGDTLNVFSKDEINQKFNALNSLTYKGTVGSLGGALPTSDVTIGDMYMVAGTLNGATVVKADGSGTTTQDCKNGDLLLAISSDGSETNGVIPDGKLQWTYVPSGDDAQTDTTYTYTVDTAGNRLIIKQNNIEYSGITFVAGDALEVSSVVDAETDGIKVTYKHGNVTRTDPAQSEATEVTEVVAVTGVTTNDQGHVTGVATKKFGLATYTLAEKAEVADIAKGVSVTTTLNGSNATDSSSVFSLVSDTLTITKNAAGDGFSAELVWGTF